MNRSPFPARFASFAIRFLTALLLVSAVGGCATKYNYGVNERFSMNLGPVPPWFGDPKAPLRPAEKEVLERRGRPDFIRVWWKSNGAPITSSDLAGRRDEYQILVNAADKSWVYLKAEKGGKDEEVVFLNDGAAYRVQPLSEQLKLLCQYGDPSNKITPVVIDGESHETWMWYEHGLQLELVNGHVVKSKNFPATGAGTILMK